MKCIAANRVVKAHLALFVAPMLRSLIPQTRAVMATSEAAPAKPADQKKPVSRRAPRPHTLGGGHVVTRTRLGPRGGLSFRSLEGLAGKVVPAVRCVLPPPVLTKAYSFSFRR